MNKYAGFFLRFLGFFVDLFLLSILLSPVLYIFRVLNLEELYNFVFFILVWLYYSTLESSRLQGTIGKFLIGIKVVDYNNNRIDFTKATLRYVSSLLSMMFLFFGYLMILFTEKKQSLHDIISKTLVVRK